MSEARTRTRAEKPLEGVDRLFGRDLRSTGWFVKASPSAAQTAAKREDEPPTRLDPAMIWSLRGRRRR